MMSLSSPLHLLLILVLAPFHTSTGMECWNGCSYQCWNAKMHNVDNPSHFLIDMEEEKIVLTAKNSVCHISLDLTMVENVWNVTPPADVLSACTGEPRYENPEKCHNFHHILLLPVAPSNDTIIGDDATPLSNTILECGSNAFEPQCNYRMRTNLSSVSMVDGANYIPEDGGYGHTTSLWLSTGRLVSATPLVVGEFGLVMSAVPYNGPIQVGTVSSWFDRSVQFVSMYEIGNYIYTFFREDPDETSQDVIYSRVSRVCKDDTGVPDTINAFPLDYNIFTTFLKARMTCISGGNGDTPYYYDELQDTFLVETMGEDETVERNLYAIFTSPANGPEGSAVCVYSFGSESSLVSVFRGNYLTETALNQFDEVVNPDPFTCSEGRTAEDANNYQLMSETAHQTSGDKLHLQLTGYSFKKILVASVHDLAGNTHDIMYITSSKGGALVLLKTVYDSTREESHVILEQELKLSEDATATTSELPRVIHMQLLGNGTDEERDAVYVGTTEALYRFPIANCERFADDCCSCVASGDPHCAYDPDVNECVGVAYGDRRSGLLQDVAHRDISMCSLPPKTTPTPTGPVDTPATTETKKEQYSTGGAIPSPTSRPVPPSVGGVSPGEEKSENYQWTIMGSVFAFIVGTILGIFLMVFWIKQRDRFNLKKIISPRRETIQNQLPPPSGSNKEACNNNNTDPEGACNFTSKPEAYERNNFEMNPHGNAASVVVHIDPITNLPTYPNHHHYSNGKTGSKEIEPPPYSPKKPTSLPSNGIAVMSSEMTDGEATPTTSHHSTPEHKRNRMPRTPEEKMNKAPPTEMSLGLSTPPKSSAPSSMQTTPKSAPPTKPRTPLKATSSAHSSPLTLTPAHRHQYRRAQSHPHHSYSSQTPPPSGHYSTLPPNKKRHSSTSQSETTPTKRPSSAEVPPDASLPRPASAQNLNHAFRTRSVTLATMPTKQRPGMPPQSPFSAHHVSQGGIPRSPYGGGGGASSSAAGTPVSTTSSGASHGPIHFKFPPPSAKLPEGAAAGSPSYWRGERSRNPNVKATGYAVEPTSNQERAMYGPNMASQCHTIDRKNKLQNGHAYRGRSSSVTGPHPQPHPETTVVQLIDGAQMGFTDC